MAAHDIFAELRGGIQFKKPKTFAPPQALAAQSAKREQKAAVRKAAAGGGGGADDGGDDDGGVVVLGRRHGRGGSAKAPPAKGQGKERNRKKEREKAANLRREELNAFRNAQRIKLTGAPADELPPPARDFEQLAALPKVSEQLVQNLRSQGWDSLTPIQMQSIPVLMKGHDLLSCAPTGSGKTASFVVPIVAFLAALNAKAAAAGGGDGGGEGGEEKERKPGCRAVILAPTRELAAQIEREGRRLAHGCGVSFYLVSGSTAADAAAVNAADVVVSTPLRLAVLVKAEGEGTALLGRARFVVLDEGDKLLEVGENKFLSQVDTILSACTSKRLLRCLFSATLPATVEELVHKDPSYPSSLLLPRPLATRRCGFLKQSLPLTLQQSNPIPIQARTFLVEPLRLVVGRANGSAENVEQSLLFCGGEAGKLIAMRNLLVEGVSPPLLVFVQSVDRAQELLKELSARGWRAAAIHSNASEEERNATLRQLREVHKDPSRCVWIPSVISAVHP